MERTRLAPTVGIAACLALVVVLVVPFALVRTPGAVATYYSSGAVNPLFAGLFALVAVIVFAAGREDRSDPALAAGAALVFGLFIVAFCVVWLASGPTEVILSLDETGLVQTLQYHPYVVTLVSLFVPAAAAWYARALGLV
ncbi:DUF7548 family protein [Halomarina litorea]|uniref:DUF7548 family protein n=1 Tax=Halomarina litorea TaxID=2961595 RepID=UPI0020C1C277|nr:hypothetical protein [Halomarina sp. BCD28]